MPLRFSNTNKHFDIHGVKVAVHGRAGAGKTHLIQTAPTPIILSVESGLLPLGHLDIPVIIIANMAEFEEAYNFLAFSEHAKHFQTVALDSISEIAFVCLGEEKLVSRDGRKAYGEMQDKMAGFIRKFRDLPGMNVYFSAQQEFIQDDVTGIMRYGPSMPGKKLTGRFGYFFDELFSLEVAETDEGAQYRYLRTQTSLQYECKDRSGALEPFEEPHLGRIFDKIEHRQQQLAAQQPTPAQQGA